MPITFGSVGDIISLCSVIQKLVKALDESHGSARDYRDLIEELQALETAIKEIERLSIENSNVLEFGPLFETAGRGAARCRQEIESFLKSIEKYRKHFGEYGSKNAVKANIAKARWQISQRDEVVKFRAHISAHSRSISLLLSAININAAVVHEAQLERSIKDVKQSHENAVIEQRNIFQSIRMWCQRCEGYFIDGARVLKDTAQILFQRLDWLRNSTIEIQDSIRQIFVLNFQMYAEILRVQSFATDYLERASPLALEAPWILEDCIGRVSPVHKQFIISWETFQSVLESRFQGLPGHNKVKRREYVLQDADTGEFIKREDFWECAFTPNRRYSMSILFDDRDDTEDSQCASCPNCQYISQNESEAEMRCTRCGILFQRIVEEIDDLEDEQLKPAKTIPKLIGPRVERKIRRRKYRPWFSRKNTQNSKPAPLDGPRKSQKRCRDDFESSESEPDHTSFKRIRIVSPSYAVSTEHKRKRVRLYGPKKETEGKTSVSHDITSLTAAHMANNGETKGSNNVPNESDSIVKSRPTDDSDSADELEPLSPSYEDKYEYLDGRRYHPASLRPNDEVEVDLDDTLNHVLHLLMGDRLYFSPMNSESMKALDLGTGSGLWAIDVADQHENAKVRGIDISPIQPKLVPPNITFIVDDISLVGNSGDWDDPSRHYDFVRCGNLCSAMKDWSALTEAAYRSLRPGGYFEIHEFIPFPFMDGTDSHANLIPQAFSKFDIDLTAPLRLAEVFKEVGFRNVQEKIVCVDAKSDKNLIQFAKLWFRGALDGLTNKPFQQGLGWTSEERKRYLTQFRKSFSAWPSKRFRGHFKFVVVYGSKD